MNTRTMWMALAACGLVAGGCGKGGDAPAPQPAAESVDGAASAAAGDDKGDEKGDEPARGPEEVQPRRGIEAPAAAGDEAATDDEAAAGDEAQAGPWLPGSALTVGADRFEGVEAFGFLPPRVAGLFVVRAPAAALRAMGYDALKEGLAPMAEMMSGMSVEATGHDLTDLATWSGLGIDLDGPMGVVSFGSEPQSFALFAAFDDRAKLDAAITAAVARGAPDAELTKEVVGDAELLKVAGYDRSVIVVRGETVLVVGVAGREGAEALGRSVATQAPASSFAMAKELHEAVGGLAFEPTALIWANAGLMGRVALDAEGDSEPELALGRALVAPMKGLAIGLRIAERAAEASIFAPLPKDALLMRLIKNMSGLPVTFRATSETPLFAWAARWDPAVLVEALELTLAAGGESLDDVRGLAREAGGVDLDKDLFGAFSGEVEVVATGDLGRLIEEGPQTMKGALVIGLSSPDALERLFAAVAKNEALPGEVAFKEGEGFKLPLPGGGTLQVEVVGSRLVATNDPGFVARLSAAEGDGFVGALEHAELAAHLGRTDQASWTLLSQAITAAFFLLRSERSGPWEPAEVTREGEGSPERAAIVEKMAALRAELDALQRQSREREQKMQQELLAKVGHFAQTTRVAAEGLHVQMGQYTTVPLAELALALAGASSVGGPDPDRAEMGRIHDALFELENELRTLELKEEMEAE